MQAFWWFYIEFAFKIVKQTFFLKIRLAISTIQRIIRPIRRGVEQLGSSSGS